MRDARLVAAAMMIVLYGTRSLSAQSSNSHRVGFYGSIGGGYGIPTLTFSDPTTGVTKSTGGGGTWYAVFGVSVSPRVALGVEWNAAMTGCEPDCSRDMLNYYTAAFTYRLSATNGFYAKINLGYGGEALSGGTTASEGGFAGGVGLGYDWHVGSRGFVVKGFVNYFAQFSAAAYSGDLTGDTGRTALWQFGVGIGYAR
jgi:hypothetical protein